MFSFSLVSFRSSFFSILVTGSIIFVFYVLFVKPRTKMGANAKVILIFFLSEKNSRIFMNF